jgi:hypothetical protein
LAGQNVTVLLLFSQGPTTSFPGKGWTYAIFACFSTPIACSIASALAARAALVLGARCQGDFGTAVLFAGSEMQGSELPSGGRQKRAAIAATVVMAQASG